MSIRKEEQIIETLYIGVQSRKVPAPGEIKPIGNVYNITADRNEIFGAPVVTVIVGRTYRFEIDAKNYPFYITTDPVGGGALKNLSLVGAIEIPIEAPESKGNVGIEKGLLVWTPKKEHTQMELYYQCNYHKYMGNKINVVMPANIG
jgi:hypothetical protein